MTTPPAGVTRQMLHHLDLMETSFRIAGVLAGLIEGVVAEL
jgi:hypothetical protein